MFFPACLWGVHLLYEGGGDVRCGEQPELGEFQHHPLLSCHSRHFPDDALEGPFLHPDDVIALVVALLGRDGHDMLVVLLGGQDEVGHLPVWDGQWRVGAVGLCLQAVEIDMEEAQLGRVPGVFQGFPVRRIGEDDVWDERLEDVSFLAVDGFFDKAFGDVWERAVLHHVVEGLVLPAVGGAEHVPCLLWVMGIPYGHPCF